MLIRTGIKIADIILSTDTQIDSLVSGQAKRPPVAGRTEIGIYENLDKNTTNKRDEGGKEDKTAQIINGLTTHNNTLGKTDIACWHCTRNFENRPIGIPYRYTNETFYTKGVFCSFKCAKAFLTRDYTEEDKHDCEYLLHMMYRESGNVGELSEAPSRYILRKFGGSISNLEYDIIVNSNLVAEILTYPLINFGGVTELTNIDKVKTTVNYLEQKKKIYFPEYVFTTKNLSNEKYRIYKK